MTCANGGHELSSGSAFCGSCGATHPEAIPEPAVSGPTVTKEKFKSIAGRVWMTVRAVLLNPVEALPAAFQTFSPRESLETGIAFAVLFDICALFGQYMMLPRWAGQPGIGDLLKILIFGFVPPAALTGAIFLARKIFRATAGTIESDVFMAGICVIPTGILLLFSGVLGIANIEVSAVIAVFALSYTILILFTGSTRIAGMAQVQAAPAVPVIILAAGWISKIVFAALL